MSVYSPRNRLLGPSISRDANCIRSPNFSIKCKLPTAVKCNLWFIDYSSAGKGQHRYRTLRETELRLKSEFEAVIKRCAAKITEMCKVEKETWIKLDQLEEDCQGLITQVEKKADALVSLVTIIRVIPRNNSYSNGPVVKD